jgi:hypothetical protein
MTSMRTSAQPRRPAGTPAGGQWAPTGHTEPDIELPDVEVAAALSGDYQGFLESEEARCGTCDGYGWVRDVPKGGFRSLAPEVRCGTCRGTGRVPTAKDWAEVGVTDQEALSRLSDGEYRPEDLSSRDRDLRLGAHSAAGTMILDGELLSNALSLHLHDSQVDERRYYQQRSEIVVDRKPVRWSSLSAEERCDHIAGYAAGVTGGAVPSDASPLFKAGYGQGWLTEQTARAVDAGELDELDVVDETGRTTAATGVKPLDVRRGYYTGFLAPSLLSPYERKAMFSRDAIVGPVRVIATRAWASTRPTAWKLPE